MSWSPHVGNTHKNQNKWARPRTPPSPRVIRTQKRFHPKTVPTSIKVISCALALLILAAPLIAANQHPTCQPAQLADMRGVLVSSSWPSTLKASSIFLNNFAEIPHSFRVTEGLTDFFESFVQKYNTSRKENYPHLPPQQVGTFTQPINHEEKIALAKLLFSIYETVETGPDSHGCLWRSKMNVLGTCIDHLGTTTRVVVNYIRSSLADFGKPKIVSENNEEVIVERKTYEAVQQQAIFTFEEDKVSVEVVSHIQEEQFDPPLELRHQEEKEPNCS